MRTYNSPEAEIVKLDLDEEILGTENPGLGWDSGDADPGGNM